MRKHKIWWICIVKNAWCIRTVIPILLKRCWIEISTTRQCWCRGCQRQNKHIYDRKHVSVCSNTTQRFFIKFRHTSGHTTTTTPPPPQQRMYAIIIIIEVSERDWCVMCMVLSRVAKRAEAIKWMAVQVRQMALLCVYACVRVRLKSIS